LIIESETVNSPNKIAKVFEILRKNNASETSKLREANTTEGKLPGQIVIGTSLLATPPKDYNFDLIIFLNADL